MLEFPAGGKLPGEVELAQQYGVSRATVRRALESLAATGLVRTRRGAGTFVADLPVLRRLDVDLQRPWREQLLAGGHTARSRLVEVVEVDGVARDLQRWTVASAPTRYLLGMHLQEADGIVLAITESWIPLHGGIAVTTHPRTALVSASGSVRVNFADHRQAEMLVTEPASPLLEVVTASRLRETGELIELARTCWAADRVHLIYGRTLVVGQIDMSELLAHAAARR